MSGAFIVTCDCGQRNRVHTGALPEGKVVICGHCKEELALDICECCGAPFEPDTSDASDPDAYCSSECEEGELA